MARENNGRFSSVRKADGAEATGTVTLTGDNTRLDSALLETAKSLTAVTQRMRDMGEQQGKNSQSAERFFAAVDKQTAATQKANVSAHGLSATYNRLGFAAHQLVAGTASFNQALQGVLGTLGPYGVAAGAVVGVVLHMVDAHKQAAEAAKKLADENRKAKQAADDLARSQRIERLNSEFERNAEIEKQNKLFLENREFNEQRREIETAIAVAESTGAKSSAFKTEQTRIQAEHLESIARLTSDIAERESLEAQAAELRHQDEIRQIGERGKAEKDVTKEKQKQLSFAEQIAKLNTELMKRVEFGNSPSFGRTGQDTLFDIEAGGQRAANGMPGLSLSGGPAIMRDPNAAANAEQQRNAALRQVELERAQEKEFDLQAELSRIEREKQAQFELFAFQEQVAANDSERLAVREQQRQAAHDAELARIAAEQTAQEKAAAKQALIASTVAGVIGTAAKIGALAAEASGKSAAKRARAAQIAGGIEALTIAGLETVKAAAAFASLNIPQGVAHTAAAALGFTQGALMLAGGTPTGGASAGRGVEGSASASGPNLGGGSLGGPSTTGADSPIPGSPAPRGPKSNASPGGHSFAGATFHIYGAGGPKEFIKQIDEGLDDLASNRRRKSA